MMSRRTFLVVFAFLACAPVSLADQCHDCEREVDVLKSTVNSLMKTVADLTSSVSDLEKRADGQQVTIDSLVRKLAIEPRQEQVENQTTRSEILTTNDARNTLEMASKQGSKIRKRNGMRSTNGTVAFYAYLSLNLGNPGYLRVLVFDRPETNEGNGYSFHSGIFTAPRTGLYVFTWTIRSCNGNGYFQTDLLVNGLVSGKLFTNGYNYSQQYGSSTGMVVIHVGQGNQVYIRTGPSIISGTICSDTNGYSSFAGWSID